MKGINLFLADGFEDNEALAVNDVLRRGGVQVNLVAAGDEPFVVSSHGLPVGIEHYLEEMDLSAKGVDRRDIMIFPGGMPGSKNLASNRKLIRAMKEHYAAGGTLAAICAAPGLVLGQLDSLEGVEFTCFDGFEDVPVSKGGSFVRRPAVRSDRIITGRSAGYAVDFAFEILAILAPDKVEDVRKAMFLPTDVQ